MSVSMIAQEIINVRIENLNTFSIPVCKLGIVKSFQGQGHGDLRNLSPFTTTQTVTIKFST